MKWLTDARSTSNDFESAQSLVITTTAWTHPLGVAGAMWKGVSLEESYQKVLDNNSDWQLNMSEQYKTMLVMKIKDQESMTKQVKNEGNAVKERILGMTGGEASQRPVQPNQNEDLTISDTSHSPIIANVDLSTAPNASLPHGLKINYTTSQMSGSSRSLQRNSFLNKIKGKVKVFSRKLAHNEQKVKEGRCLLGKVA
ncbi:hypothetical protein DXG03_001791 [Asterophora parasitica]|uniref:Uncharacterized protein n=1 Tax=Asterophora parasitica TaxID=117018 RepID=A0A9P7FZ66_9AGAR|nr:hypothetical protein DXG03_001791 [Asterophora parasitica]